MAGEVNIPDEVKAVVKDLIAAAAELYDQPSCTDANAVRAVDVETLRTAFDLPAPCVCGNPEDRRLEHYTGVKCFDSDGRTFDHAELEGHRDDR